MNNFCGIDFGTSNSTLGIYQDNSPILVNLEHNHQTLPSAIFYEDDENEIVFGTQALDYYKHDYSGRLMRSFKSILGTSIMHDSTRINNVKVEFLTIIEIFLKHMKQTAENKHDCCLDSVVLGRPIHFIDDNKAKDAEAQAALMKAAKKAGFKNIEFQFEPIAASLKYEQSLTSEKLALIVDIGGGTSDISIIRLSPERAKKADRTSDCLANSGIHIGGTDFDKNLSLKNVMPMLGFNQLLRNGLTMPKHFYMDIATWHRINFIYQREFSNAVRSMKGQLKDPIQFELLHKVIEEKLAFSIASLVEEAKISLSHVDSVKYDFDFLKKGLSIDFSKDDLALSIKNQLESIDKTIDNCINDAGLMKTDINAVFLTGGSSQMQIIKRFISQKFANIAVDNQDSLSSVGIGLTLDAKRRFCS
ncbi:MAG: Hsp70 family protein [Proteobacteria bacterium]|nr:Hsp70 family protein [Pseudomonadota bacterium]